MAVLKKATWLLLPLLLLVGLWLFFISDDTAPVWTAENALQTSPTPELFDGGNPEALKTALEHSIAYYQKKDPATLFQFGSDRYSVTHLIDSLIELKQILAENGLNQRFLQYIQKNYRFYKSAAPRVLYTGYYEASLKGSWKPTERYRYPLYKKPDDLVRIRLTQFPSLQNRPGIPDILRGRLTDTNTLVPYYNRKEIDDELQLQDRSLELLFVDNKIDLFFLQIQGSGVIRMVDGETVRVNYADSNGHPYRAIGRHLVQQGYMELKEVSMQSIRGFLENNPDKINEVFNYNPSYVFFRTVEKGPIGSLGFPVTAFRSIATDRKLFPKGALCFIRTQLPEFKSAGQVSSWSEFGALVMNQDTGGAIRTPARVDLFTGFGSQAELIAGNMKRYGELYFLVKRNPGAD